MAANSRELRFNRGNEAINTRYNPRAGETKRGGKRRRATARRKLFSGPALSAAEQCSTCHVPNICSGNRSTPVSETSLRAVGADDGTFQLRRHDRWGTHTRSQPRQNFSTKQILFSLEPSTLGTGDSSETETSAWDYSYAAARHSKGSLCVLIWKKCRVQRVLNLTHSGGSG